MIEQREKKMTIKELKQIVRSTMYLEDKFGNSKKITPIPGNKVKINGQLATWGHVKMYINELDFQLTALK